MLSIISEVNFFTHLVDYLTNSLNKNNYYLNFTKICKLLEKIVQRTIIKKATRILY